MEGGSVVRNSLEAGITGPTVQWEDEMDPGLKGDERVEREKVDDCTDWGRGNLSCSGSPESKNSHPPSEFLCAMRMFVPGSNPTSESRQHMRIPHHGDRRDQLTENWSLRRRPKGSYLRSGMPGRDKVEDSESRGEWRRVDSAVIRAFLS